MKLFILFIILLLSTACEKEQYIYRIYYTQTCIEWSDGSTEKSSHSRWPLDHVATELEKEFMIQMYLNSVTENSDFDKSCYKDMYVELCTECTQY